MSTTIWEFVGNSGNAYRGYAYSLNGPIPPIAGVYIVTRTNFNRQEVVYIGQSDDIKRRFSNHEKLICMKQNGGSYITIIGAPQEDERYRIEKDLILRYYPPCNEQLT